MPGFGKILGSSKIWFQNGFRVGGKLYWREHTKYERNWEIPAAKKGNKLRRWTINYMILHEILILTSHVVFISIYLNILVSYI